MKKIYCILTILCLSLLVVSCVSDFEETREMGFLKLELTTFVSTNTRAVTPKPAGYNAKKLAVKIADSTGKVVMQTDDFSNDAAMQKAMELIPGEYTVSASSSGWDGSDSAFDAPYYAGSTKVTVKARTQVTANVTLTQANVKVSVKFDDNFRRYFSSATCMITSGISGVAVQNFNMNTSGSAYFPVGDLEFFLIVTNNDRQSYNMTKTVTNVKARDHYIINYRIADAGSMGGVTVRVDDATQEYSFDIQVPRKSGTSLNAKSVNAWSNFADLAGEVTSKTGSFDAGNLKLQWKKKADTDWHDVESSALTSVENDKYAYKLVNLTPATEYVYRFVYADEAGDVNSNEVTFTTESQGAIYNGGFENWYMDGSVAIAGKQGDSKYWNSSNAGAANFIGSVTTQDKTFVHGGSSSAKLATNSAVGKLAAASLFTGDFIGLVGTKGAKLEWGVPFTARPSALKGYMSYSPGSINIGSQPSGVGAPAKNGNDACQIFCALVTEIFKVANTTADGYQLSTAINWQTDPRVIAYGELTQNSSDNGAWKEFSIPLTYHTLTAKPTHLIIVSSASKWGDYFYGSSSSVLYLDDFEFVYGQPVVK